MVDLAYINPQVTITKTSDVDGVGWRELDTVCMLNVQHFKVIAAFSENVQA